MEIKFTPRKLEGSIKAMPSKSHAHRLLIAQKISQMQGQALEAGLEIPAFSDDIEATMNCLAQLDKNTPFLQCGESGSTLRFLLPVVMALKGSASFLGTGRLPDRPISPLKEEMELHGCSFQMGSYKNDDNFKEICSVRGRLMPGDYALPGNISSQFITGLLFALPLLDGESTLTLTTELESAGYVDMTLEVLRGFGLEILTEITEDGFLMYRVPGNQLYVEPAGLTLEGDWSNAAFWLAAGTLSGDVTVCGLNLNSCQRDREILDILIEMGARPEITTHEDGLSDIRSVACCLQGAEIDVSQIPDLAPVLAVLMSSAEGTSMIIHGERLRFKESNRMKSIYAMLYALEADISYGGDRLSFTGKAFLEGGHADSRNDHRIAMAVAVASCLCRGDVFLENPIAVTKSYPDFYNDFIDLGGELEYLWNQNSEKNLR
ncbi:MAG: 3-phosphoshikimate 1-carboxyvinyltransferase [Clostridia bacterium]|nr:3-phosphoshikimate 1-carboxyvinyltransferase [Clostridia bacterium]